MLTPSSELLRSNNVLFKPFIQLFRFLSGVSQHSIQIELLQLFEVSLSHLNYHLPHSKLSLYKLNYESYLSDKQSNWSLCQSYMGQPRSFLGESPRSQNCLKSQHHPKCDLLKNPCPCSLGLLKLWKGSWSEQLKVEEAIAGELVPEREGLLPLLLSTLCSC